jgi:undecaprenyl-diphosphatase
MVCLLVAVVGLVQLTDNVVDHDGLTAIDLPWHEWFVAHRTPVLTGVMYVVSFLGQTVVLAVLAACAVEWLIVRRERRHAVLVAVTTLGAALLVLLLKHIVARVRPPVADRLMVETSWSYPSGHSLGATAVLGVLAVVATARLTRRLHRVLVRAAVGLLVAAIGVSRVYLGVHWPSDVLAGWLVGGLWLAICLVLTSRWRRRERVPDAPVLDARTDQELRRRYLDGQISIGTYLDRKFGTNFGSAGDRRRAG